MWSLIGIVFGALWVAVNVPAYFLQLTVVHWGDTSVRSFADLRPAPWAQNVLGWGLFLGIAALASSRVFEGTRRALVARWLLAASGAALGRMSIARHLHTSQPRTEVDVAAAAMVAILELVSCQRPLG
jgi:hypothetical protein